MKWPGTGFTVELPCGERVYMGTLEEMAQREASGIYGPDPCVDVASTNGHVPNRASLAALIDQWQAGRPAALREFEACIEQAGGPDNHPVECERCRDAREYLAALT